MNGKWIIFYLILFCVAGSYALSGQRHEFKSDECVLCHTDEINDPGNLKPAVTKACETCHTEQKEIQTHPTDIYPTLSIPKDMTLIEGRMTCITCHYVHPKKGKSSRKGLYFLRRQIRGQLFCAICHEIDERGHIIKDDVHTGSYKEEDSTTRLDMISLECIECHDTLMKEGVSSLGAGTWGHFSRKFNHPIGISYIKISSKKSREFHSVNELSKELRLFDGKIGCGTCHNIYSKVKNMLVFENAKSRLCLECHIK